MGVFWLSLGALYVPIFGVAESYSTTGNPADGYNSPGFNSDLGLYLVAWGLGVFVMLICTMKTNIVSIVLFAILDAGLFIFAASHLQLASGNSESAIVLQKVISLLMSTI